MHHCSWTIFKIIVIEQRIQIFSVYCNEWENHIKIMYRLLKDAFSTHLINILGINGDYYIFGNYQSHEAGVGCKWSGKFC